MTKTHPAAHVDSQAKIGLNVTIGPGAFVGADVELGDRCEIGANVVISGPTSIGPGCRIFPGAVIGLEGQVVNLEGDGGGIEVGPGTVVREMATVHRSIYKEQVTRVGSECYLMVQSHVAHDCQLGDRVILTNATTLGGHVEVGNDSFITGFVAIHQFVCIGEGVMLTGPSPVRKDVPPFSLVADNPPRVRGLNMVGLRRRGVSSEIRGHLKRAYRILYEEAKTAAEAADQIESELPLGREIQSVIEFIRSSKRGVYEGRV